MMFRHGKENCRRLSIPAEITQAQKVAVGAVAIMLMLCLEMAGALQAVVVVVDGFMVNMERRYCHQW